MEDSGVVPKNPASTRSCRRARPRTTTSNTKNNYWFAAMNVEAPVKQPVDGDRGFDLDHACTCGKDLKDGAPSCNVSGPPLCDFANGIDDAFAALSTRRISLRLATRSGQNRERELNNGSKNVLLYLSDYNGKGERHLRWRATHQLEWPLYDGGCDGTERPLQVTQGKGDLHNPPDKDRYKPCSTVAIVGRPSRR